MSNWCASTANAARGQREFELADTGVFDDSRYFDVFVEYAKATSEVRTLGQFLPGRHASRRP